MTETAPRTRRKFADAWDEIGYLYDKVLYWFYRCELPARARRYAAKLRRLLSKLPSKHESIFEEECWSLVSELWGDLPEAIRYRENEIRLIKRLHASAKDLPAEQRAFVLQRYDLSDLSDRMDLLAMLYHDDGQLDRALSILRHSKALCSEHGLPFDGADLVEEYTEEKRADLRKNGRNGKRKR